MKEICILIYNANEPLPEQGGMERVTDRLARGLRDRGYKVMLLCSRKNRLGKVYNPPVPLFFVPQQNPQVFILDLIADHHITHVIDQTEGGLIGKYGYFKQKDMAVSRNEERPDALSSADGNVAPGHRQRCHWPTATLPRGGGNASGRFSSWLQGFLLRKGALQKWQHILDQEKNSGQRVLPLGAVYEGILNAKLQNPWLSGQIFNKVILIAVQHNSAMAIIKNYGTAQARRSGHKVIDVLYNTLCLPLRRLHSLHVIKKLYREQTANYDYIVMLSPSFIKDFLWFYPQANKQKLLAIPNMNTYTNVRIVPKQKRVLFVGRLISSVKGCDKLLRIWKEACQGEDDWQLDIVGDGPDRDQLMHDAEVLGISNCTFHGFTDPTPFYERASIFCMASVFEGFGMVLTEAMQHGMVPMAFASYSAVYDLIEDGVNGVLVQPFDEHSYAQKLHMLMQSDALRRCIAERAVTSVERFSSDTVLGQWEELLHNTAKA